MWSYRCLEGGARLWTQTSQYTCANRDLEPYDGQDIEVSSRSTKGPYKSKRESFKFEKEKQ